MPVLTASLWTRAVGTPRRLATVVVTETGATTVSYDGAAVRDRLPGISMVHDLAVHRDVVYPASYANLLPPALVELAPPHHPAGRLNPQRAIVEALAQRVYAERGWRPANQSQAEWDMLLLSGRGGIGVLDVFPSDESAERWYATAPGEANLTMDQDGVAAMFRDIVASTAMVPSAMVSRVQNASLPSVGGMMPKVLARYEPDSEALLLDLGGGALVQRPGVPVVAKVEATGYEGIIELEALAYKACAAAGLSVPRVWTLNPPNFRPMLVVERADCGSNGRATPMETMYSVLFEATVGAKQKVTSPVAAPYEMVADILQALSISHKAKGGQQLFRQVLISLLTGNGDLHMRNMALLGTRAGCQLSPVFDPAPMRAWSQHNIVMACNFGGLDLERAVAPSQIGHAVLTFSRVCGLSPADAFDALQQCLAAGQTFIEDVNYSAVPDERKRDLVKRVGQVRIIVEAAVPPSPKRKMAKSTPDAAKAPRGTGKTEKVKKLPPDNTPSPRARPGVK